MRDRLGRSNATDVAVGLTVDGIHVRITKDGAGRAFVVSPREDSLEHVTSSNLTAQVLQGTARLTPGAVAIGRLSDKATEPGGKNASNLLRVWPTVADADLERFVSACAARFEEYLMKTGHWASLGEFLRVTCEHHVKELDLDEQDSFIYWWLTGGAASASSLHSIEIYDDCGLFVIPSSRRLPIFTDELHAAIAAESLGQVYDVELTARNMGCLGCYLEGVSGELGRQTIAGAILDEQWPIEMLVCNEGSDESDRHFTLNDGETRYHLVGCQSKGTFPVWVGEAWHEDRAKEMLVCDPQPWC